MQSLTSARFSNDSPAAERPATELESIVQLLQDTVLTTLAGISIIQCRIMPTAPQATQDKPRPIATTYADKLREILTAADSLREIVNELSSRI